MASGSPIAVDLHVNFIKALNQDVDCRTEHLVMNGSYWGISALKLLGRLHYKKSDVVSFVLSCRNEDGGFGGNKGLDSHMLHTMSAVQLLCLYDALDAIDVDATAAWVASMQLSDGSFQGDKWGEVDTRFVYIGLALLRLLGCFHLADRDAAVDYVLSCQNWDGGFGASPGAESHAGQIFCCVGALSVANALSRIDPGKIGAWLAMRQLPSGGFNGRPEKKADVCYSWWVISSLSTLGLTHWIDREALFRYILTCQDTVDGGFSDKPGNEPDVYHTFFALCGLSLLDYPQYKMQDINPVYALPYATLERNFVPPEAGVNAGRKA